MNRQWTYVILWCFVLLGGLHVACRQGLEPANVLKTDGDAIAPGLDGPEYSTSANDVVVRVYDSRSVALAYWREEIDGILRFQDDDFCSPAIALEYWSQEVDGKPRFVNPGGEDMEGKEHGVMMHQQVFSYHDPVQALEHIVDELPSVMNKAGVDVIVSMWDREALTKYGVVGSGWDEEEMIERNPGKVVDVTLELVQLYNPSAELAEFVEGVEAGNRTKPEPLDTDWLHGHE